MSIDERVIIRLNRSQQIALVNILVHYILLKDQPQNFVDVVNDVTTTTGELLTLVTYMSEVEMPTDKQ
jgi:hypothetical protein